MMERIDLPTADDRPLWDTWMAAFHFPTLTAADALGLFPLLASRPATAAEVATRLAMSPTPAEALLGVLTALGFLVQRAGRFHLSDTGRQFMLPESPYYWGPTLEVFRGIAPSHDALLDALTEERASEPAAGEGPQEEHIAAFTRAMHGLSFPAARAAAAHVDFSGVRRLLDAGGGSGGFCIALAQRYPELRCTVFDWADVCRVAERFIADHGLADRIDTAAGDMFNDPWPAGYDAVLFSNVWHDFDRDRCRQLARRSREALPAGGRIFLHEILLADTKDGPLTAAAFSMAMQLFNAGGKQYTAGELDGLLREAGFGEVEVTATFGYYALVSGRKL
jgi:SAM-dependent methyltransferase